MTITLLNLPVEIQKVIFSKLRFTKRCQIGRVCKLFYSFIIDADVLAWQYGISKQLTEKVTKIQIEELKAVILPNIFAYLTTSTSKHLTQAQ